MRKSSCPQFDSEPSQKWPGEKGHADFGGKSEYHEKGERGRIYGTRSNYVPGGDG
jgi:hypothetical protein